MITTMLAAAFGNIPIRSTLQMLHYTQTMTQYCFTGYVLHLKRNKYLIFQRPSFSDALQRFCKIWKHPVLWIIDMDIVRKAHHRSGSNAIRILSVPESLQVQDCASAWFHQKTVSIINSVIHISFGYHFPVIF